MADSGTAAGSTASDVWAEATGRTSGASAGKPADDANLGLLVARVSESASSLIKAEVALAKHELSADAKKAGVGAIAFVIAATMLVLAMPLLLISMAYGLTALGLAPGWAFLIVFGVMLVIAVVVALIGVLRLKRITGPKRAVATTSQSIAAVKSAR